MNDRDASAGAVSTGYHSALNLRLPADDGIDPVAGTGAERCIAPISVQ